MTKEKTSSVTLERIKGYLESGKRFDGRKPEEFRELTIEQNVSKKAEGSVRVKLGKTEVVVGIKMNVGEPYPDSPKEGNLMVTAELLPLSSSRIEAGPPSFDAIELGRVTDRGIRESKFIDFSKLCIKEGEKVWTVFIDIYSINDDGNLFDAAGIGAIAALKAAKIPKYDEKEEKVLFGEWTENPLPLVKDIILPVTIYKIGDKLVLDPNKEEEDASETRVTIGVSKGVISSTQKGNPKALNLEEINNVIDLASKSSEKLVSKVEKFLK